MNIIGVLTQSVVHNYAYTTIPYPMIEYWKINNLINISTGELKDRRLGNSAELIAFSCGWNGELKQDDNATWKIHCSSIKSLNWRVASGECIRPITSNLNGWDKEVPKLLVIRHRLTWRRRKKKMQENATPGIRVTKASLSHRKPIC